MSRQDLAALPKGVFTAEDWIDDDGITSTPLKVQVKVTITDDRFIADFTGSAPQAQGPINNSRTGLVSAVRMIFKALTNPHIPANAGCFRAVDVVCPDCTVFTAKRPAPVSTYWETQMYATGRLTTYRSRSPRRATECWSSSTHSIMRTAAAENTGAAAVWSRITACVPTISCSREASAASNSRPGP